MQWCNSLEIESVLAENEEMHELFFLGKWPLSPILSTIEYKYKPCKVQVLQANVRIHGYCTCTYSVISFFRSLHLLPKSKDQQTGRQTHWQTDRQTDRLPRGAWLPHLHEFRAMISPEILFKCHTARLTLYVCIYVRTYVVYIRIHSWSRRIEQRGGIGK